MLNLVGDVVKYFSFDDVNVDNWVFKLFYKGAFIILLVGSMVGITSQYFGEPINCDFKGIDSEMASDYCWIHGSPHMKEGYYEHTKCAVDKDRTTTKEGKEDTSYDTSYYQWVTFALLFQAGTFMLPYKIWRALEGGLIEEFGLEAKSGIILKEDNRHAESMDSLLEKYVLYYKSIFHRNQWYFGKYIFCEILNFVILVLNFYFTDVFLSGNFWYYGSDWIEYSRLSSYKEVRESGNPLCNTFPLEVSCSVPNFGAAGGIQKLNGMCVLTQNIINQKMYLVIWFYMAFLILTLPVCIFYRVITLFFDCFRSALLIAQLGNTNDKKARNAIREIMSKCYIGDWFVLFQLSKNVNMYFFRAFVKELAKSLKLAKRSSQRSNQPKITYIEKEKVDNHLPSGPLLGPKKIPDDDSDDDYIDDDVEQGASSNCSSIKKTPRPPPPLRRQSSTISSRSIQNKDKTGVPNADHRKRVIRHAGSRVHRLLPGKGHSGRKVGNRKRSMSGYDDFEMNMMLTM